MKISVKKQDIGQGVVDSLPKSVSIQLPKIEEPVKPKIVIPTTKKSEEVIVKETIQIPQIVEPPKQTYGVIHNEQPVIKQELTKETNKDSVLDTIDTGFGDENTLHKECPAPKFHQHLCKDNFLSEFKTELQKQLARDNLGVYSKEEVKQFLQDLNLDTSSFITKNEIEDYLQDLDFVKSTLKSNADYNIPDTLFKL